MYSSGADAVGRVSAKSPRRPMARGALVRLQARDGSRTADNEPSLACRASASITGCVRKSLLRLRPSAYLTRDHRLGAALSPVTTQEHRFYSTTTLQPYFGSNTRTTRFRLNHPTSMILQTKPLSNNNSTSTTPRHTRA